MAGTHSPCLAQGSKRELSLIVGFKPATFRSQTQQPNLVKDKAPLTFQQNYVTEA